MQVMKRADPWNVGRPFVLRSVQLLAVRPLFFDDGDAGFDVERVGDGSR